jgi:aldehyde:ferredoxin oxidoreductase
MTQMTQRLGALPTRNFRQGSFEGADEISGESLRDMLLKRSEPSLTTHACMPGCAIRCSNVVGDSQGEEMVSPLEYETIALLGSNLGIADLDAIARLNWRCNDLGLDTIEIGAALGVAAEAEKWFFGDHQAAAALLEQIAQGTPLGTALGNGAVATGHALGVERVPAVKGQAMAAYDPRAVKGTGVTYATSPQGADHTAGITIRAQVDHRSPEGQVELSRKAQLNMAGYDTLGACLFAGFGFSNAGNSLAEMVSSIYSGEVEPDILMKLGEETLRLERAFNMAAGLTAEHDRLPGWMEEEPLPPTGSVFDVPHDELDRIWYEDD